MRDCLFNMWGMVAFFVLSANGFNLDTKSPLIFRSDPGNYFGFSVALHRNRNGPLALIGAPRANLSVLADQIYQPGVLYQCETVGNLTCREIVLDKKGNTHAGNNNFAYHDKKDDMWLGVSLDIRQHSDRKDIVTCGHLWKNQLYAHHYLVNGACYVINGDLDPHSIKKLVPFIDKSKQSSDGVYQYAFGQVGTSAAYTEDGEYLLLGAPGYSNWIGTVVSYALNPMASDQDYTSHAVPAPSFERDEPYIGYSVSSGKFYENKLDYVAVGAPRDGGFHGCVYIYKAVKSGEEKLLVHQKKEGYQFGEYFGATVLGINLNADSYTDLLVGSPLYSSDAGVDEGKVYVFISNGLGLQLFKELYGKNKPNARFGTAISNAGDLNRDGYNDVAIGAPYEDEKGAIYIYHGSRSGINIQYVQRIAAVEINPGLSGFGIQISRGFDIDQNKYPDILVGSYASSNAVLFRTRPVVQVSAKISFSPNPININVTNCYYQGHNISCLNVTACLWYEGKSVPLYLEFEREIFVEHANQANLISPRGFFLSNGQSTTVIQQQAKVKSVENDCYTDVLYIRHGIKDFITPIQILYRYNLIGSNDRFNESHPILDPFSSSNITSSVTFQTGCGRDDKCFSDLSISASILGHTDNSPLIVHKHSTISLSIKVVNLGEPAYLSELLVSLPPELSIIKKDSCTDYTDQRKNVSLICHLGNPLTTSKTILIKLDTSQILSEKKEALISLEAVTGSNETNPEDNYLKIPLRFKAIADISITGTPSSEQITYDVKTNGRIPVSITHTFFIMNHGPSPVQIIDIKLNIPTSLKENQNALDFVTFTRLETDGGKLFAIAARCNETYLEIKPEDATQKPKDIFNDELERELRNYSNISSLDYGIDNTDGVVLTRFRRTSEKKSPRKKKDVVIDCNTAKCMAIECSAFPFEEIKNFAKIEVSLLVNMSILNEHLDPWYQIEFITSGEVFLRGDSVSLKHHHPDKTMVKTIIVSSSLPASEEIAQWIIFVSIGIGILLLLIILILLIKFGFFKREQKEKMEKMRSKADRKEYDPCEGESTESEALN